MISISGCAGDTLSLDWYFFHRKHTRGGKNPHSKRSTIYGTFLNLQMLFLSSLYFKPGIKKLWIQGFDYVTRPDTYLMRMIASKHKIDVERVHTSHPLLEEKISFEFLSYIFAQFRFMIDFETLRKVPKIFMIVSGTSDEGHYIPFGFVEESVESIARRFLDSESNIENKSISSLVTSVNAALEFLSSDIFTSCHNGRFSIDRIQRRLRRLNQPSTELSDEQCLSLTNKWVYIEDCNQCGISWCNWYRCREHARKAAVLQDVVIATKNSRFCDCYKKVRWNI